MKKLFLNSHFIFKYKYNKKLLGGGVGIKLLEHWLPLYCGGQIQWKLFPFGWHWPPFWHGFGLQGSYFVILNV